MQKIRKEITILLCLVVMLSSMSLMSVFAADGQLEGAGTQESPWLISDAEDFVTMSSLIKADASYADDYYQMTNDIDFTGVTMTAIGKSNYFSGVFDGQLYAVKNLTLKDTSENTGLFAYVEKGTIKNLGIVDSTISGAKKVGALAGRTMNATLINCYSKATVTGTADVGGLVGMFNSSDMNNCYSHATVTATSQSGGGVAGSLNTSLDKTHPASLDNVYSIATVTCPKYIGIITGYEQGATVVINKTNVYYYGDIVASGNYNERAVTQMTKEQLTDGTLLQNLNANLADGYAQWLEGAEHYPEFTVSESDKVETSLKGAGTEENPYLIETAEDLVEMANIVDASDICAKAYYKMTANIDLQGVEFHGIASEKMFGGTFDGAGHVLKNVKIDTGAENYSGVFHRVTNGTIKNLGIESGTVEGGNYVGGIAGCTESAVIINCFNAAMIQGYSDVGGLVGQFNSSTIENSFNKGLIRASFKSIGGLTGSASATSSITNSYNVGHVNVGTYTGKLVGYSGPNVKYENVYYDKDAAIANQPIGNFTEFSGIIGMTKAGLTEDTFADTLNANVKDGNMQWVYGADKIARLAGFEETAKLDIFMASIETVTIENNKVQPIVSADGAYKAVVYGSDNKNVIDLEGNVYQPLTAQKVLLMFDIVNTATGEVAAQLDRNIEVIIEGKYADSGINEVPNVVPGLREWYGLEGNFAVTENTRIAVADEEMAAMAVRIQEYMKDMLKLDLEVVEGEGEAGDIVLKYVPDRYAELQDEGYAIEIDDQIVIEASIETAMLYGSISIMQILYQDETHTNIPKGYVRDYPQYEMRGGMLDVARKYFSLDYIEEIGKYMSWFKLNTLSLHINDNGGEYTASFVVESKKYPELNTYNGEYVWSQDDYRQMQKNLKTFGVDVITEIDSPGHAKVFGLIDSSIIKGDSFNLNSYYDESLALVENVFDEFLDGEDPVFQNAIVHIGTDEAANATNENMRKYIRDLSQYVLAKENVEKVIFWGNLSLYYGQTDIDTENVATQIWSDAPFRPDEALDYGFEVINSRSNMMYLVPNQSGIFGPGVNFSAYTDMALLYDTWEGASDFDTHNLPNPLNSSGENYYAEYDILKGNPKILGTLFCDWNDKGMGYDYDIMELILPYIASVSEKCWYGDTDRFESGEDFAEAFHEVGNYAPYANPRYRVDSESNMIASYRFEEMTSEMVLDSVNGYHAKVTNGTIREVNGNHVLALDGTSSVALPFKGVGYPYTVTLDLYLDGEQSQDAVLFGSQDCTFYLDYEDNGVSFKTEKYVYSFNVDIPTDKWVEVKITSQSPGLVHASTNITVLTIDGMEYTPSNITNSRTQSKSTVLGTEEMFVGVKGYVDNLEIANKYGFEPALETYRFEGSGTAESPYLIQNAQDLKMFSLFINAGIYTDACFELTADIDMKDVVYKSAAVFSGTLDGDGHRITNLTISESDITNVGLIGFLDGGTIRNLGLKNVAINGKNRIGAFAGRTMYAVIMNCYSTGMLSGSEDVGGLVGMYNNSEMYNCYSLATVTATKKTAGGIFGSLNTSLDRETAAIVDNVYYTGTVTAPANLGGITGWDERVNPANPIYATNIYYFGERKAFANYDAGEVTLLTEAELADGTLLNALNKNLKYGYKVWAAGEDGYPTLTDENLVLRITKQPVSIAAKNGVDATVTIAAQGEGLTYTWYYKNPGNVKFYESGSQFVSEDGTSYTIPMYAWRDGQEVYCVVTDKSGDTVQSNTVALTMDTGTIQIIKQPEDVVVNAAGDEAVVTVEATGTDLTYQWYYKNPGNVKFYVSGDQFVSEDGATYTIPVAAWRDGQQVYCVITDANGISVQTNTVTLSVAK